MSNQRVENILQFPDEVLQLILSHVPVYWNASESCSRLYDISCDTKLVSMVIQSVKKNFIKLLDDEQFYSSIINSSRRIGKLVVRGKTTDQSLTEQQFSRLTKVFTRFGADIKHFQLESITVSVELIKLLNHMPNLEKLVLKNIPHFLNEKSEEIELNLHELKEIESEQCTHNLLKVFSNLPDNVLRKIKCNKSLSSRRGSIFLNQDRIDEIETDECVFKLVEVTKQQVKLISLKAFGLQNIGKIVKSQKNLRKLHVNTVGDEYLALICKEMRYLEDLKITIPQNQRFELTEVSKLKNLKRFDLSYETIDNVSINSCLSLLKLHSLTELTLKLSSFFDSCLLLIPAGIFISMGMNMPHLRKMSLSSGLSMNSINLILESFPYLEYFEFDNELRDSNGTDLFVLRDKLIHENLKEFLLFSWAANDEDLPRLIGCCTNLEILSTTMCKSAAILEKMLCLQPKIRKVNLVTPDYRETNRIITPEFVNAIKLHGEQLEEFHTGYTSIEGITEEDLQEELRSKFSHVILGRPDISLGLLLTNDMKRAQSHEKDLQEYEEYMYDDFGLEI